MSELITPEEFIQSKEFVKAIKDIDKSLQDLLKTIGVAAETNKKYNEEVKKGATSQKELQKNQDLTNKSTKETVAVEKELAAIEARNAKLKAQLVTVQSEQYKESVRLSNQLKKEKAAINETMDAEAKRKANIGKYKEDIVKAYVAIQATLMVAKAAFNAVNNAIQENETTAEFVERKIGGLGAAYDVLKGKLFGVIEGLIKSDESSIKWGNGLRNFLSAISMGFSELIPSVRNVGNEMNEAAKETEKLIAKQQDLADLEGDRILNRSIANKQLVEARDLAAQEGISNEEKKKFLKEAISLEKQQTDSEIKVQSEIVANLIAQGELKKKLKTYDVGREGLAIKQAEAKLNDLITESLSRQRRAKAQLRSIDKEIDKSQIGNYSDKSGNTFKNVNPMADWDKQTAELEKKGEESLRLMNDQINKSNEEKVNSDKEAQEKIDQQDERRHQKFLERKQEEEEVSKMVSELQIELANAGFDLGSALYDRQLANLEASKQKELKSVGDNEKAKDRINQEYAKKEATIRRKAAILDKAQGLFNAGINIALGITNAASKVVTLPLIPYIATLGALQIATILAKPIPKFFKGVKNFKGGLAEVGEKGFELVETKKGESFLTPDKATKMLLPQGSTVHTHEKTIEKLKGMDNGVAEKLLHEQRLTRKALGEQVHNETKLTENGLEFARRRGNSTERHINIYFRR